MKLAILGADPTVVELADAAARSGCHEIAWLCEFGSSVYFEQLRSLAPRAQVSESWELLLDQQQADAVLVAQSSDEDLRTQQLRMLVQVGIPLLVAHPVVDSMLVYYELDMIRRDTHCRMMPYLPLRLHPALREIASPQSSDPPPSTTLEQVIFERYLKDRTRQGVQMQLARDLDVIRAVCGDLTHVTAVAPGPDDLAYANLGVQLTGQGGLVARWSVVPTSESDSARLTLVGPMMTRILSWGDPAQPWQSETRVGSLVERKDLPAWDPASAALDQFAAMLQGSTATPDWIDAARSIELAEAVDRSVRKGRTVELHYEDHTEEGTFKGTMASLGCGLLILGLFAVLAVALAEQAGLVMRAWPKVLAGVLGVFLALQLLMLLFPSRVKSDRQ